MKGDKITSRAFYQNLGKLFYAIAIVDGTIDEIEIKALKDTVSTEWLFDDDAFSIIDVFHWLNYDQDYNAEACYDSFMAFKNENEGLFTDKIKTLILRTANAIAFSFSGKNKSELIMLAKLSIEFKKQ